MNLIMELTPEQERQLCQAAAIKGVPPDILASELLSERLAQVEEVPAPVASEEWNSQFAALISEMRQLNMPPTPEEAFRRENLYDDRGL